jgi:hypothetical protein
VRLADLPQPINLGPNADGRHYHAHKAIGVPAGESGAQRLCGTADERKNEYWTRATAMRGYR